MDGRTGTNTKRNISVHCNNKQIKVRAFVELSEPGFVGLLGL